MTKTSLSTGFTPRVFPRPQYPSTASVARNFLERQVWIPLWTCAFLFLVFYPFYRGIVYSYKALGFESERFFLFVGLLGVRSLTGACVHGFFYVTEYFLLYEDSRMNRKAIHIPKPELVSKSMSEIVLGTCVVQPIILWIFEYPVVKAVGMPHFDSPLFGMDDPNSFSYPWETIWYTYKVYVVCHLMNELIFYGSHRLLHHPALYARIHKKHHDYRGTVSHASEYSHFVETLFGNILPTFIGPLVFAIHPAVFGAFVMHKLKRSYEHHSGFSFHNTILDKLGLVDPETAAFHDFHHTTNQGNFGCLYVDWLFGTMDHFVAQGGFEGYVERRVEYNPSYLRREEMEAHLQQKSR